MCIVRHGGMTLDKTLETLLVSGLALVYEMIKIYLMFKTHWK